MFHHHLFQSGVIRKYMKKLTVLIGLIGMAAAAGTTWTFGFGTAWASVCGITIAGMVIAEVALSRKVKAEPAGV
jgi:hypothetical protein